jgi:hypothetical protein
MRCGSAPDSAACVSKKPASDGRRLSHAGQAEPVRPQGPFRPDAVAALAFTWQPAVFCGAKGR